MQTNYVADLIISNQKQASSDGFMWFNFTQFSGEIDDTTGDPNQEEIESTLLNTSRLSAPFEIIHNDPESFSGIIFSPGEIGFIQVKP